METPQTAASIAAMFRTANADEFAVLDRAFAADTRKTVQAARAAASRRLDAEARERERSLEMYRFQESFARGALAVGLDEAGRGPLAGPLAVAAVVLPAEPKIMGLDDSKKLGAERREELAEQIEDTALAWSVCFVDARQIDSDGMTACLRTAFGRALAEIEAAGFQPEAVLLDGNPLHFDPRETSIVKGDAKCASIAAASILAKVGRDALMVEYAKIHPEYGFERNKGYGSKEHTDAIRKHGLCDLHRKSFCNAFVQETLF